MAERRQLRRLALGASIILLASLLQFHQLTRDLRFHPDEAFFMTFALGAAVNGDWLLPGALDKPPLSIYLSAQSMVAFGNTADANGVLQLDPFVGEFAGRLPNVMLALLLTALTMRLASRLYADVSAAVLAGLLVATSPFMLAYGASAFTDMSLLYFSLAALTFSLGGRWAFAGAALGLAFWSKQQAVFVATFLLALHIVQGARRRDWLRFLLPFGAISGLLLLWDASRPEASIFLQAASNNAPTQLIAEPAAWLERLTNWLESGAWLLGPPLVTVALIALLVFACMSGLGLRQRFPSCKRLFMAALALYSLSHVVFNFNLYDRYLLLALPLLILLVAGSIAALGKVYSRVRLRETIVVLLLLSSISTLTTDSPIGGDRAAYAGIDKLAEHLNSKPVATVIYDPWLGWELGYYLGQWHDKRRAHYPTADALLRGALALDEVGDRYLVTPVDEPYEAWLAQLRDAGFGIAEDYRRDRFVVYRLSPPKQRSPKD